MFTPRIHVIVAPGVYNETVRIAPTKGQVSILGQGRFKSFRASVNEEVNHRHAAPFIYYFSTDVWYLFDRPVLCYAHIRTTGDSCADNRSDMRRQ